MAVCVLYGVGKDAVRRVRLISNLRFSTEKWARAPSRPMRPSLSPGSAHHPDGHKDDNRYFPVDKKFLDILYIVRYFSKAY